MPGEGKDAVVQTPLPPSGHRGKAAGLRGQTTGLADGGPASISACFLSETFRCPGSLQPITPALFPTLGGLLWALRVRGRSACVPVKETSASLSCPSSWTLSLSDVEPGPLEPGRMRGFAKSVDVKGLKCVGRAAAPPHPAPHPSLPGSSMCDMTQFMAASAPLLPV